MEFSAFERAVIELILSQPIEGMDALRRQFATASVIKRDYTGVGFYTDISVDRSLAPAPYSEELDRGLHSGAIGVAKSAPDKAIMFDLWLDAGYLACLEGVTSDSHWPNEREIKLSRCVVVPARRNTFRWTWPWSKKAGGNRGQSPMA